jgi:HEPN domain-containing protein
MIVQYKEWIRRAKSNLALSKSPLDKDIVYEDLCFNAQQAVEKALKGLLLVFKVPLIKTHNLFRLCEKLSEYVNISEDMFERIEILSKYSSEIRYPGEWAFVSKEEYLKCVKIAEECVEWVESKFSENINSSVVKL